MDFLTEMHVVAFDVPYPANYGGVIDIYHKVEALAAQGVRVHLHCYQYGRATSKKLNKICKKVHYYPRRTFMNPFYGKLPYIVSSRNSTTLLNNLLKVDAPILFEGLHCTYHLPNPLLQERFKVVRMHNIEHHYYRQLELVESRYFKKYFFRIEAERLKKHLSVLKHANAVAAISPNDLKYLARKHPNVFYLPAFHPNNRPNYPGDTGDFVLYHGNLGVAENYEAAMQLVRRVFSKLRARCVIAGNNPPRELLRLVESYPHIEIQSDIPAQQIDELIARAHVNVLYTQQATGIKLKLLNALYKGKHVVVNPLMVKGTELEELCVIGRNLDQITEMIEQRMERPYSRGEMAYRLAHLDRLFHNGTNAKLLLKTMGISVKEEKKAKDAREIVSPVQQA